jgi:hypothetical protein
MLERMNIRICIQEAKETKEGIINKSIKKREKYK